MSPISEKVFEYILWLFMYFPALFMWWLIVSIAISMFIGWLRRKQREHTK